MPVYSDKKTIVLNQHTILEIGKLGVFYEGNSENQLRIRVIEDGSDITEHTILLPIPRRIEQIIDKKEGKNDEPSV